MLGRFIELSLTTPDIRASLEFYGKLGFTPADVGDAWSHPYAVVTDGRLCLGLHQESATVPPWNPAPSLTFVKPQLFQYLEGLERLGVSLEFRRLGPDVFNEIGWLDPSGHLIRLIEARTFSPSKRAAMDTSLCGYFTEIALPTPDRELAKAYWERLGFVGLDEADAPLPHVSCTSDTITIGLYEPSQVRELTLLFDVNDFGKTMAALQAVGIAPAGRLPASLRHHPAAVLVAPEGTPVLLMAGRS